MANVYQMYQGESRALYVTVRDSNGVIINFQTAIFIRIEVRLINEYTFETLAKWWFVSPFWAAHKPPSGEGWIETSNTSGGKIELFINGSYTKNISTSHLRVQVNTVETDTDYEDNEKVLIYSSVLARLLKAKQ